MTGSSEMIPHLIASGIAFTAGCMFLAFATWGTAAFSLFAGAAILASYA